MSGLTNQAQTNQMWERYNFYEIVLNGQEKDKIVSIEPNACAHIKYILYHYSLHGRDHLKHHAGVAKDGDVDEHPERTLHPLDDDQRLLLASLKHPSLALRLLLQQRSHVGVEGSPAKGSKLPLSFFFFSRRPIRTETIFC